MPPENPVREDEKRPATAAEGEALLTQYAEMAEDAEDEHQHDCPCCRER